MQLQTLVPNKQNKISIYSLMDETRKNRNVWMVENKNKFGGPLNVKDILDEFPKFSDFKGDLVSNIKLIY